MCCGTRAFCIYYRVLPVWKWSEIVFCWVVLRTLRHDSNLLWWDTMCISNTIIIKNKVLWSNNTTRCLSLFFFLARLPLFSLFPLSFISSLSLPQKNNNNNKKLYCTIMYYLYFSKQENYCSFTRQVVEIWEKWRQKVLKFKDTCLVLYQVGLVLYKN